MPLELACCTETLLNEIANGATRTAVAQTYRLAMHSRSETDWKRVNEAIIARWSVSGLTWIKKQAWSGQCFEIRPQREDVSEG
jgi:hypothetical protein